MCDPTKLDKIKAESEHEQHPLVKKVMEEKTPDYISAEEVKDEKISDRILDQIQMIVDPFVVCQYQRTKQRGFLFLQSESTLAEFRFTKRKTPEGVPLNRTLICHYVTIEEYIAYVSPELELSRVAERKRCQVINPDMIEPYLASECELSRRPLTGHLPLTTSSPHLAISFLNTPTSH